MIVTCVHVRVNPEHVEDFIEASRQNHLGSVQEPGNARFDICQSQEDPAIFLLYEAYDSAEASAAHKETSHYQKWRDTVAEFMAQPRTADRYTILFPEQASP
jgi:autoinducer 2-degrading protein